MDVDLAVTFEGCTKLYPLASGREYVVGRSRDCTVRIADPLASRRHAALRVRDGVLELHDLASDNGTAILDDSTAGNAAASGPEVTRRLSDAHGAPANTWIAVARGAAIRIGTTTLTLRRTDPCEQSPIVIASVMTELYAEAERIARSRLPVLLAGETGVGKDVLAGFIHRSSGRSGGLLRLNCAGIAAQVAESELFGHERGAFTGANHAKPGLLSLADGGSVFLDELAELPVTVQSKLLRFLDSGTYQRVGSPREHSLDVRILAATNQDLRAMVASGAFRQDLYYRIAGISLRIPPLRDRPDEIVALARHYLASDGVAFELTKQAEDKLLSHAWPGNVRELRNCVMRARAFQESPVRSEHILLETRGP